MATINQIYFSSSLQAGDAGGTQFTGSIYKICCNGSAGKIGSASMGWASPGVPNPPTPGLAFHLGGNAADELQCVEADFSAVSCSNHFHIYHKVTVPHHKGNTSGFGGSFAYEGKKYHEDADGNAL